MAHHGHDHHPESATRFAGRLQITGVADPDNADEVATKGYADSLVAAGVTFEAVQDVLGEADSAVDFNGQKITGLGAPSASTDAARKTDADAAVTLANAAQSDIDTHEANTSNPHSVTKTQVGLGSVTNDAQLTRGADDWNGFSTKTPTGSDVFLMEDAAASGAKKKQSFGNLPHSILSGVGSNTHSQIDTHIASTSNPHSVTKTQVGLSNVTNDSQLTRASADFASFTAKTTPVGADLVLIEDSAASGAKKKSTLTQIFDAMGGGGGGGGGSLQDAYDDSGHVEIDVDAPANPLEIVAADDASNPIPLLRFQRDATHLSSPRGLGTDDGTPLILVAGGGGDSTGATNAGASGAVSLTGQPGGDAAGSGAGGSGTTVALNGSDGGDSATGTPGNGGSVGMQAGDGGDATAGSEDGGTGGDVIIDAGAGGASDGGSTGQAGVISIGETKALSIGSGSGSTPWVHAGSFDATTITVDGDAVATTADIPDLSNVTNDAQLKRSSGDFNSFTSKATPVGADILLIEDSAASNAKKKTTFAGIPHTILASIGTNTHAQIDTHIASTSNPHSTTASQVGLGNVTNDSQLTRGSNDWNGFTSKATPVAADVFLIEDSAASGAKKKATGTQIFSALAPFGTGSGTYAQGNDSRITGALPKAGGTMTGAIIGTPTTTTYASSRTLDVSTNNDFIFTDTWTGNITITLSNASDGCQGVIWAKQDGTGSHTVAFTTSGRTQLMDDGITAFNTSIAAANKVFGIGYSYATIGGTAYVTFSLLPLKAFA
jgi:hypothetical protein